MSHAFHAPELLADYSLLTHNTFGFDVRARHAMKIDSVDAAVALCADKRIANLPQLVLGGGSNIVLTRDFDGVASVVFRLPKAWTPRAGYADVARALEGASTCDAQAIFDAVVAVRRAKLPDWTALGNAGSFFKNPVVSAQAFDALKQREPGVVSYPQADGQVKLAAGWLIDQCGWKGRSIGGAAVHDRQALVLVNRGGATGAQVLELADAIKRDVLARFDVELEMEPVCL
jgi:UDP-N-acetylenolpyruvoylglucosamine reductase